MCSLCYYATKTTVVSITNSSQLENKLCLCLLLCLVPTTIHTCVFVQMNKAEEARPRASSALRYSTTTSYFLNERSTTIFSVSRLMIWRMLILKPQICPLFRSVFEQTSSVKEYKNLVGSSFLKKRHLIILCDTLLVYLGPANIINTHTGVNHRGRCSLIH